MFVETFDQYGDETGKTAIYPEDKALEYLSLGLVSEAGEVAGKVKKIIRDKDGQMGDEDISDLASELGDVLWYLSELTAHLGLSFGFVARANLAKLRDRQKRGAIGGSGDHR